MKINLVSDTHKASAIEEIRRAGPNMVCEIKRRSTAKTLPQLGYVFGVAYPAILEFIEDSTGDMFTKDELHDWLKKQILGPVFKMIDGEEIEVTPVLHNKDKKAWSDYIDKLDKFCYARWGLMLPRPGE